MIFEHTICSSNLGYKVHKSRKLGDDCTQASCHFFLKSGKIFARDQSFGISPESIDCWNLLGNENIVSEDMRGSRNFRKVGSKSV